jgi:hypothetical protein
MLTIGSLVMVIVLIGVVLIALPETIRYETTIYSMIALITITILSLVIVVVSDRNKKVRDEA